MKRGTPDHPKMQAFAEVLNIPIYAAVGLLELLWQFTSRYAPAGDIGRWSDVQIRRAIRWDQDGDVVAALLTAGWFDTHESHRLLVHDWPEHADDLVHRALARAGELFADGTIPRLSRLSTAEREEITAKYSRVTKRKRGRKPCAPIAQTVRTDCAPPSLAEPEPSLSQSRARYAGKTTDTYKAIKTPIPTDLQFSEEMRSVIIAAGCTQPELAFQAFVDFHAAKQNKYAEWSTRVWRTWAGNHGKYGCPCQGGRPNANGRGSASSGQLPLTGAQTAARSAAENAKWEAEQLHDAEVRARRAAAAASP